MRKPFYWKQRGAWYVKPPGGKSQIRLHEDEKEAYKLWQEMQQVARPEYAQVPFFALAENYLKFAGASLEPESYSRTRQYLVDFCKEHGHTQARAIKPHDVTRWLASHAAWGGWSRRAAVGAVKRVYSWAVDEGLIDKSPISKVKRPHAERRESLISDEQHVAMIEGASHGGNKTNTRKTAVFRQVLIALRHSGARPGMVAAVRREDIAPDWSAWVLAKHKTQKKTGKPLIVYLSPCLQTLCKILAAKRARGPLFLNADKKPWDRNSIRCRMRRLREKLGLPPGTVAYAYRHTWTTNALLSGTDLATVAELLGHTDLKMVAQHYGHLNKHAEHLKQAAAKAMRKQQ